MLKEITIEDLERWKSCYTEEDHIKAARGRKSVTPLQVANMRSIPAKDRLWVLLRPEIIPENQLRLLACDFAERALLNERKNGREPDKRSWNAIAVSRAYANGEATKQELQVAIEAARKVGLEVRKSWVKARAVWIATKAVVEAVEEEVGAWAAAWAATREAVEAAKATWATWEAKAAARSAWAEQLRLAKAVLK